MDKHIWPLVLALCLFSRAFFAIYYIEDTDSLRFAQSILDYDVSALKPHFPGYPVYCFGVKTLYAASGSFALSFALAGGLSVFGICWYCLKSFGIRPASPQGLGLLSLLFFNPLLWLMSERYMPDAAGAAICFAAFYHLSQKPGGWEGFALIGILAGLRLSYIPFVLPAAAWAFWQAEKSIKTKQTAAIAAGTLVWFIPFFWITGWENLLRAALKQTQGHFFEFGGAITATPGLALRTIRTIQNLWADGMGLGWEGRAWPYWAATVLLLACLFFTFPMRGNFTANKNTLKLLLYSCAAYLLWAFLFQNMVYKSRHILPLLPAVCVLIALFIFEREKTGSPKAFKQLAGISAIILFIGLYAFNTLGLCREHKYGKTAAAQIKEALMMEKPVHQPIVSIPLMNYYLKAQFVPGIYIDYDSLETSTLTDTLWAIGNFELPAERFGLLSEKKYSHDPYMNRMWPDLYARVYVRKGMK